MFLDELVIAFPFLAFLFGKDTPSSTLSEKELIKKAIDYADNNWANEEDEKQSVILETPSFNINKIKEYKGEVIKKFEFRPRNFKEFISQDEAKERVKIIIPQIKRGMKGHIFISSCAGMGKTTFINIFAKELNAKVINRIGRMVEEEELLKIINEINTSEEKYIVLFIDEIETCNPKILKILNPIIESFEIANKRIKPFVFCCASINKHSLITTNPDLLDRITNHIPFKKYSKEDIIKIIKQYKNQLYKEEIVSEEVYKIIANNGKFNPRISIPLLEKYITIKDINKVLKSMRIVKNGLTEKDIEILKILNNSPKPMGENALAIKARLNRKEYALEFEPFLFQEDYINRIPSRIITKKGKELLKSLK